MTMTPPTEAASIYDAPELYDVMFERFEFDLPFWAGVARDAGGPILDVGCRWRVRAPTSMASTPRPR